MDNQPAEIDPHSIEVFEKILEKYYSNIKLETTQIVDEKIDRQYNDLILVALELIKAKEKNNFFSKYFSLFTKRNDYFNIIKEDFINFYDGLILCNLGVTKNSIIVTSNIVPYNTFLEYRIKGYGNKIYFMLFSNVGAQILFEVIQFDRVIKQELFFANYNGVYICHLPEQIKGEAYIRFKTMNQHSITRFFEIHNRKLFFFARKSPAYFLE